MTIHVRNKGHSGEREACRWLEKNLFLRGIHLDRNVDQVRDGGADIISLRPFAIEVKRCESILLNTWWKQALRQRTAKNPIPVLMFRQNRHAWRFCMNSADVCKKSLKGDENYRIELGIDHFIHIADSILTRT